MIDSIKFVLRLAIAAMLAVAVSGLASDKLQSHTSTKFEGPKANTGTVTHSIENGKNVLAVSEDFTVPQTPDPHWQVVDSKGNVYLLNRLPIKDDKVNRKITVPSYIRDIAKVQIWCAFAETLLGEATFEKTVALK